LLSFGTLALAGFAWAGGRVKRTDWIGFGVAYSGAAIAAVVMATAAEEESALSTAAGLLLLAAWIGSSVHAFLIRRAYLNRLAAQPRHATILAQRASQRHVAPPPQPPQAQPPGQRGRLG
jgi:hypothetical protein